MQPIVLQKIRKARKSSSHANSPLKKKRARTLAKTRLLLSGDQVEASELQISSELKLLPKKKRTRVCGKAGILHRTTASRKFNLALKTHCNLTWGQLRMSKRYVNLFLS